MDNVAEQSQSYPGATRSMQSNEAVDPRPRDSIEELVVHATKVTVQHLEELNDRLEQSLRPILDQGDLNPVMGSLSEAVREGRAPLFDTLDTYFDRVNFLILLANKTLDRARL